MSWEKSQGRFLLTIFWERSLAVFVLASKLFHVEQKDELLLSE